MSFKKVTFIHQNTIKLETNFKNLELFYVIDNFFKKLGNSLATEKLLS